MKDIEEVNELKLRLSAGVTGTQNIGNYNNKDLYGPNDFLGKPGIIPTTLGNNDLRWERTKQFDIAVDYALLDYRLRGSIGWYYKNTNDLLWYIDFPTSLQPFSGMYKNVGRVQNKGFEWIVDAKIFRETEVKWDVTFNLAVNRNKCGTGKRYRSTGRRTSGGSCSGVPDRRYIPVLDTDRGI